MYIFFSKILGSQFYNVSSSKICTSIESSDVHVVAYLWWYDSSISNKKKSEKKKIIKHLRNIPGHKTLQYLSRLTIKKMLKLLITGSLCGESIPLTKGQLCEKL